MADTATMKVLIVGSARGLSGDKDRDHQVALFERACWHLGGCLAADGVQIIAGSQDRLTADYHVVQAAMEYESALPIRIMHPEAEPVESYDELIKSGRIVDEPLPGSWHDVWPAQVEAADAVVLIGGGTGPDRAFEVATEKGIPVVLVAAFGGTSQKLFHSYRPKYMSLGLDEKELAGLQEWSVDSPNTIMRILQLSVDARKQADAATSTADGEAAVDFMIITTTPEDYEAVRERLPAPRRVDSVAKGLLSDYLTELPATAADGEPGHHRIVLRCLNESGRLAAASGARDAIDRWRPRCVLLVGTAIGLAPRSVRLGDVIVASEILDYESQEGMPRESADVTSYHTDARLLGIAEEVSHQQRPEWGDIDAVLPGDVVPGLRIGRIAFGDQFARSGESAERLLELEPDLLVVEMGAGEVARALLGLPDSPEFLVICGIGDLAYQEDAPEDVAQWSRYAAAAAATFAVALLKRAPIEARRPKRGPDDRFTLGTRAITDFWTDEDLLGYESYAEAIAGPILSRKTKPPLTIAVQAPWGQGKSSLMRMIRRILDRTYWTYAGTEKGDDSAASQEPERTKFSQLFENLRSGSAGTENMLKLEDTGRIPTVWFNPLYYRKTDQVWAGLAHATLSQLAKQLGELKGPVQREKFWLMLQAARVDFGAIRRDFYKYLLGRFLPKLVCYLGAVSALVVFAGIAGWSGWFGGGVSLAGALAALGHFLFWKARKAENLNLDGKFLQYVREPAYEGKLGLLHLVDQDLDRALKLLAGEHTIAVFIDDLDRCSPETVVEVILAINQFLSLPDRNVIFILGIDMQMVAGALETSLKNSQEAPQTGQHGGKSPGWAFMEKFIQLPFFIPHLEESDAKRFLKAWIDPRQAEAGTQPAAEEVGCQPTEVLEEIGLSGSLDEVEAIEAQLLQEDPQRAMRPAVQRRITQRKVELLSDPEGPALARLVEAALTDLQLNPRAMKRFLNLARLLRALHQRRDPNHDDRYVELLVVRTTQLILSWPEVVRWLQSADSSVTSEGEGVSAVEELEEAAGVADQAKAWQERICKTWGNAPPQAVHDARFFQFVKRITADGPGLNDMYEARLF